MKELPFNAVDVFINILNKPVNFISVLMGFNKWNLIITLKVILGLIGSLFGLIPQEMANGLKIVKLIL